MQHTKPIPSAPRLTAIAALLSAIATPAALAQSDDSSGAQAAPSLPPVTVKASADASAQGLSPVYPGGQVARAGRAGLLGTRDAMETPFAITSYTHQLLQDRQARSVGEVLQNDPGVRVARGFGNFQEAYFIRGFILDSDDTAFNGLYSLLPRQYIATELFERVEVLRGASAFLNGASPGGGGIGGSLNLLPKRAPNEPLNRVSLGLAQGGQTQAAADVARRFGPDGEAGLRVNAATRSGGSAIAGEDSRLALLALGLDWRSRDLRLSGDIGWQEQRLANTRPSVALGPTVDKVPAPPAPRSNFAQAWSYSNERDLFGALRGEWDLSPELTAWAAAGARRSAEANRLANLTLSDAVSGAASSYRFDNSRRDSVGTGEIGLRGQRQAGGMRHQWVALASHFDASKKNAYAADWRNPQASNLYGPIATSLPGFGVDTLRGGELADPLRTGSTRLSSLALGDTVALADQRLLLTAGLRQQKIAIANYAYGTALPTERYAQSRSSPLLAAIYKLSPSLSLYANAVQGLSQGQTAPAKAANRGEMLAPYVSRQKEIGVKFDGAQMSGSLALFSTTRPRAYLDASSSVFSAQGKDRHRGIELALQGEAAKGLRLLGGLSWLDARQQSTGDAASDGRRVIGVPRLQANWGVEHDIAAIPGLAVDARLVHTGSSYANAANSLLVPGWNRVDVGLRYLTEVQDRLVTLRARIDNLGNRRYWASAGGYPGQGYLVLGTPRTLFLSASVDF